MSEHIIFLRHQNNIEVTAQKILQTKQFYHSCFNELYSISELFSHTKNLSIIIVIQCMFPVFNFIFFRFSLQNGQLKFPIFIDIHFTLLVLYLRKIPKINFRGSNTNSEFEILTTVVAK